MKLSLVTTLLVLIAAQFANAADPCFTMTPTNPIGDGCKPVPVTIQFKDCASGNATDKVEAVARYECKSTPPKLKYWYKTSMLVSDLEQKEGWGSKAWTVSKSYVLGKGEAASKAPPPILAASAAIPLPATKPAAVVAVNTEPPPPAPAPASPEVPVAPTAASAPAINPAKFKFSGLVDIYYAYNTNTPDPSASAAASAGAVVPEGPAAGQNQYRIFDVHHDQFSVSLAKLTVQQAAEPAGFRIDLGFGPAAEAVAGSGSDPSTRALMQAYVSYKVGNLTVDAGKFVTHMGYEVIEAQDNANYSRSVMFGYLIPYWHNGVRATYAWAPNLTTSLHVLNGWGNYYETNKEKTLGAQVNWTVADGYGLIVNYINGNEGAYAFGGARTSRAVTDLIFTAQPNSKWKFAVNWDGLADTGATTTKASSVAGYATYNFNDTQSLSLRYEMFDDSTDGFYLQATPVVLQKLNAATVTYEHKCAEGVKARWEVRQDTSDQTVFTKTNADGTTSFEKTQATASVSLLASF
ncbi:MAG: porin [Bdellovibrionia bacterium]